MQPFAAEGRFSIGKTREVAAGLREARDDAVADRIADMNEDKIKGQWKQLAGKLKAKWGKLTDDDLRQTEGDTEYLAGRIQERYGVARDEAKKQVREFEKNI